MKIKHVWALLIKFTAIAVVLFSILGIFTTATLGGIFFIALFTTVLAYFVGDLFILPKFDNAIATVADFGLSFFFVWLLSVLLFEGSEGIVWASVISAAFIAAAEALFHIYVYNHVLTDSAVSFVPGVYKEDKLLTEYSEEFDAKNKTDELSKKRN